MVGGHKAKGGVLLVLENKKSGATFKMASQFFPYIQWVRAQWRHREAMWGKGNFIWICIQQLGKGICHFVPYPSSHMKSNNRKSEHQRQKHLKNQQMQTLNKWEHFIKEQVHFWGWRTKEQVTARYLKFAFHYNINPHRVTLLKTLLHSVHIYRRVSEWVHDKTDRYFFSSKTSFTKWLYRCTWKN